MNEFAKLLSAFVKEKGVKIQPFARYCGYDRANMYKILKGQRNLPGREIVEKAAKYMHLLPSEEEKLWEAYEISAQGSDNYYRRKEVQKFFTEPILSSNVNITALTEGEPAKFCILDNESIPLRGGYEIDAALFRLIGEESRNKDGHLRLMIQPESNSLSSILSVHGNYACNTRIDHIVCLSSNPENIYIGKRIIIWIACGVCCHSTIIIMIIIPGIITVRFRCRRKNLVFFRIWFCHRSMPVF